MSQISSRGTGGGGSGIIETITGDTGSITGANVTIFANRATLNSGSSVSFNNSGTVSTFNVTDSIGNTLIGNLSGNLTLTGVNNTSLGGESLKSLTSGNNNVAIGQSALESNLTSGANVAIGLNSLNELTGGIGDNVAIGVSAGNNLLTGTNNVIIGSSSGLQLMAAESNNILIENSGVISESGAIRVGSAGTHTTNFQSGITGVTVAASAPVAVASTGQLSSLGFGTATQVLTSNGAGVSPTWQAAGFIGSPVYFQAYLTSNTNYATGSTTEVAIFDTAIANVGSAYNTGTGVFTAPSTGFYSFSSTLFFTTGVGTTQYLVAYTGSVQSLRLSQIVVASAITSVSWSMPMTAGDTVSISPFADGTGNFQLIGASLSSSAFNTSSTFSGFRVA